MTPFVLNVLLALVWVGLTGVYKPINFAAGYAFSFVVLLAVRRALPDSNYYTKVPRVLYFVAFFLWELFRANLRVAYDVLTPRHHMRPGVVAVPLELDSDAAITLLANLITLTPGTLSLDVSADRRVLYVHTMYIEDPDTFRCDIKQGFEHRVKELLA